MKYANIYEICLLGNHMIQNKTQFRFNSAVIVCHDAMFGPPHELRDYLFEHGIQTLLFIGHPNKTVSENVVRSSYFELYRYGKRVKTYVSPVLRFPELLGYAKDLLLTVFWTCTNMHGRVDYFIGLGNLNAFGGLILRIIWKVKRVYYYVIDYIPNRYRNKIASSLYLRIDNICARHSDTTWNYAKRMLVERKKQWKETYDNQLIVPNGIHIRTDVIRPFSAVKKTTIVYLGTLREMQGIQKVIQALPIIRQSIQNIHLNIIGKGVYVQALRRLTDDLHMQDYVTFVGYVEDPLLADKHMATAALGVATYNPKTSFSVYAEPGKVKRYLSCGVPVIMTDVTPLGKDIERNKCGMICKYDADDIARKITEFLKDSEKMKNYRLNAIRYATRYEWERIFTDAFLHSY